MSERAGANPSLPRRVELHGHRGARGHAPENTIAGFAKALAIGVDALELDLCMSNDGALMVHHDLALNPDTTRDAKGNWIEESLPLIELDSKALKSYDVGRIRPDSPYRARFPHQQAVDGEQIPSLEELFSWIQEHEFHRIRFNIEMKSDPLQPERCAEPHRVAAALLQSFETFGIQERVLVQSFDWRIQRALRRSSPSLRLAYLSSQRPQWDTIASQTPGPSPWTADIDVHAFDGCVASAVSAAGGDVWTPDFRDLDDAGLRNAHGLGLGVVVWTVNEDADIMGVIDLGVDGIISDYPDRVQRALKARGLPLPAKVPS